MKFLTQNQYKSPKMLKYDRNVLLVTDYKNSPQNYPICNLFFSILYPYPKINKKTTTFLAGYNLKQKIKKEHQRATHLELL